MLKFFINILLNMVLGKLRAFAISVVEQLNAETLTNEEKREKAFDLIKEQAKTEGKALRDSLIALGLELAVSYLKKQ